MLDEDMVNRAIIWAERGETFEEYVECWQLPDEEVEDARELWDSVIETIANLKPGQTLGLISGGMFDDDFAKALNAPKPPHEASDGRLPDAHG